MLIHHQDSGKLVHHNFVSVLLNDLYGIQARGGCACAGPYAQVKVIGEPRLQRIEVFLTQYVLSLLSAEFSSYVTTLSLFLEQSIECCQTKTTAITLANHKGQRAIHCPIKTRSNYTNRGKTCSKKSLLVLVLLLIGQESGASF